MIRECIQTIEERYPDYYYWKYDMEHRNIRVPVAKIVGTSGVNNYRFNPDWTPRPEGRDPRWERVFESMKGIGWLAQRYSLPSLIKVKDEYFVVDDGNRRVSVAHMMGLKYIMADVTEMYPGTRRAGI